MNYPQLYLPKEILENLDKVFPSPVKPTPPTVPIAPSKKERFFISLGIFFLAAFFFFIKSAIIGLILTGFFFYFIFSKSEKRKYEEKLRKYNYAVTTFNRNLKEYENYISFIDPENYQEYKRRQSNDLIFSHASKHLVNVDYKKGISHNHFKGYLSERFGDSIVESASILSGKHQYYENDFNLYVTDFAFICKSTNLKIDIEIDEPYTFKKKQPIHLNDKVRNDFFIQNNWVVVRFAEEQIINHPELCCDFINNIINCFDHNFLGLKKLKSNIPEVQKWDSESVKFLIENDYRKSYLHHKILNPYYFENMSHDNPLKMTGAEELLAAFGISTCIPLAINTNDSNSKILELNPNDATAYYNKGLSKVELKDFQGAIADYSKAIELNPNYVEAYSERGNAKGKLKDYDGALLDFRVAIELTSKNLK